MDGPTDYYAKSVKGKCHRISLIGEILNYTNKLIYKTKNRFTDLETEMMVTR